MGRRYAYMSQKVLYSNVGKLLGINVGYGLYLEHELLYRGPENERIIEDENDINNPFKDEIIVNPNSVKLIELCNGNVLITNDEKQYERLIQLTKIERLAVLSKPNVADEIKAAELLLFLNEYMPEIEAFWGCGSFNLISTTERSAELLKTLYEEIQKGNVAISNGYPFIFGDRGLSFILLDQLSPKDYENKKLENQKMSLRKSKFLGVETPDTDEWEFE